MNKITMATK